jgi:glucosylceramidase
MTHEISPFGKRLARVVAAVALIQSASATVLLDIGLAGKPVASAADFTAVGVKGLSGTETVGNVNAVYVDDPATSFVFTTGQTMTFSARAQGAFSKDLGNEMLNDYMYLQQSTGHGGPITVTLGNLGLDPGAIYTLHLFGREGSSNQRSAFTPLDTQGITFSSLTPSNGDLTVRFTTSASYAGEPLNFTWERAAGSPNFAAFNGIAIRAGEPSGAGTVLTWKCSTESSVWADKPDVSLGETIPFNDATARRIVVNSSSIRQRIDGWGGCFNERGWKAMEVLAPAARDALMNEFFHPQNGLRLDLCRTPIGASDYAIDLYSLNETPGDYSMANFSIARDRQRLIPFIKAAQAIRPDLKIWASPWSPPSWMKNNNSLSGAGNANNSIKDDAQTLDALALYFARYVEEYAAEGIPISMVMPQNEPNMATNYTSCLWTGSQLAKFIGYHLGPKLEARGLSSEIYLGTINDDDDRGGYAYWVEPCIRDTNVQRYLDGVGCQWDSADTMGETQMLFPDMKLMQTEAECGNHENNWTFAEYQYGLALKWFNSGAGSNIIWNLVLDETGLSTGGWAQCSPVVVNSTTGQVTYTPYFHLYKHFSHFIESGAHLTSSYGSWDDRLAFTNPDGSVVVVLANRTSAAVPVTLNIDGNRSAPITIPAHSFNTFSSPAPVAQAPTALEAWRTEYFGTASNSEIAADDADSDGDGMINKLEFAVGSDPTRSQASALEVKKLGDTFEFRYRRSIAALADGADFTVEWSDSMGQGTWNSTGVQETVVDQDQTMQQMKAVIPADSKARFARLRVDL